MSDPVERSASGQPIYRYQSNEKAEWAAPSYGEAGWSEKIEEHFEKHIGKIESVFHEIISETVHIDVHHIKPTAARNYHTLFTTGMSFLPMNTPEGLDHHQYAELMVCLPPAWPISDAGFQDDNNYWPIRWLKMLARLPHEYNSWLGPAHTIPNGDPPTPLSSQTKMSGIMLLPSTIASADFKTLTMPSGTIVRFYSIIPLYQEEMNYKLNNGAEALLDKLNKEQVNEIIHLKRKNVMKSSLLQFWKK
jgi:hypothetical protein